MRKNNQIILSNSGGTMSVVITILFVMSHQEPATIMTFPHHAIAAMRHSACEICITMLRSVIGIPLYPYTKSFLPYLFWTLDSYWCLQFLIGNNYKQNKLSVKKNNEYWYWYLISGGLFICIRHKLMRINAIMTRIKPIP